MRRALAVVAVAGLVALVVPAAEAVGGVVGREAAGLPLAAGCELPGPMTSDQTLYACAHVGYPLIIKASAGGGGKGMSIARSSGEMLAMLAQARRIA